jgi:hypothetical protein
MGVFGLNAVHAHIVRELLALDQNRLHFGKPQETEELLVRHDIVYHNGDMIKVFHHGSYSYCRLAFKLSPANHKSVERRRALALAGK